MQCSVRHAKLLQLWQSSRSVSSLTPLGAAFNSKPQKSYFFPRDKWPNRNGVGKKKTGLFQFPELDSPNGFEQLKLLCADRSQQLVTEACSQARGSCPAYTIGPKKVY